MARITIPHAVTDFADLRERGFYYVDPKIRKQSQWQSQLQ